MAVKRLDRVNSLLRRVIAESMTSVLRSPQSVFVTVTDVSCGKDLRDATVKVSIYADEELKQQTLNRLQRNARLFQEAINREVRMKFTPRLVFQLDRSIEKGDAVLELLSKLQ